MPKLTKAAQYFIIGMMVLIIGIVGFLFVPKEEQSIEEKIVIVKENIELKAIYYDSISKDQTSSDYTECSITILPNEEIAGYPMTNEQSFKKYIQLLGPDGKEVLTKQSKETITHYAYSFLLTGDIIEKTIDDEKTYEIVNARITYNRIPFALLEMENKACIRNNKKNNVKIINLKEFTDSLADIEKRKDIISW